MRIACQSRSEVRLEPKPSIIVVALEHVRAKLAENFKSVSDILPDIEVPN